MDWALPRSGVGSTVKELQKQGHAVHSEAGRGYELAGAGGEVLCRGALHAFRRSAAKRMCCPVWIPTNLYAKRSWPQAAQATARWWPQVYQTAGRGRLAGAAYASPEARGCTSVI